MRVLVSLRAQGDFTVQNFAFSPGKPIEHNLPWRDADNFFDAFDNKYLGKSNLVF